LVLGLFIYANPSFAFPNASSWELASPKRNEVIKSGELFIDVRLLDSVKVKYGTLELYIDDNLITNYVKFAPDRITILYTLPLPEGQHTLQLKVNTVSIGYLTPITSTFYINKFSGDKKDSVIVKKADFFELSGNLMGYDKQMNYAGPGAAAASSEYPNVSHIQDVSADVVARIGKVSFPFKYFNTSDQSVYLPGQPGIQSRNYLQYGIRYQGLELLLGDQTASFDRLVTSGIRVKGQMFTYEGPRFKLQVVNGISAYGHDGQKLRYHPSDSVPPPATLAKDSSYIIPGVYQRQITAARLSFGNRFEGSVISINLMRSRDDTSSIKYGGNASDNLVVGADESFVTNANKMRVNAGFAISGYTANIKGGPASESQIDSLYGYKVGFNPSDYKSIFVLNATTIKPDQPSMADYLTAVFRSVSKDNATDNLFTIDYHYFGNSYISFGNPLVQSDLWAGKLQDQLNLLNRRIIISASAIYQENNVAASDLATLTTKIIDGSVTLAPSPKLPQLSVMVDDQIRANLPGGLNSNLVSVNDNALNITTLLNYNLNLAKTITSFHVSYTNNGRTDEVNTFNSNTISIISGGITETYMPLNLSLDARITAVNYSNPEMANLQLSNTFSLHLRQEIRKLKTTVSIGADLTNSQNADLIGSSYSNRDLYNLRISTRLTKGLYIDLEAGIAPYTDLQYSSNSYQENYALVRLNYDFDFRR